MGSGTPDVPARLPAPTDDDRSWWCGLTREELHQASAARSDLWQKRRIGLLDAIGERLQRQRESWEGR